MQASLEILIEPGNSLVKCTLLGEFKVRLRNVSTHRKSMFHATEQVYLVWLTGFCEDALGLVAL